MEKKHYYQISEVIEILGLEKASVIRYWEQEIRVLNPKKAASGKRLYNEKDIKTLMEIKQLKEEGYTLSGINKVLVNRKKTGNIDRHEMIEKLKEIRAFLSSLLSE